MDHDVDVIGVVEGGCAAFERGVIEVPLRRGDLPNELREVMPVFVVTGAAALGGQVILVPPLSVDTLVSVCATSGIEDGGSEINASSIRRCRRYQRPRDLRQTVWFNLGCEEPDDEHGKQPEPGYTRGDCAVVE